MSGYFVPANIERLKITHTERSLLSIIVGICKASATGTFYGSDKYLADRLDVSERQVRRMLETFTERTWVSGKRPHMTASEWLLDGRPCPESGLTRPELGLARPKIGRPGPCSKKLDVEVELKVKGEEKKAFLETWEQCFEAAAETYRELLKREPGWLHRDTLPLMELCSNPSITVADFEDRWVSFLQSTEPFTRKMRGNLKFFCEHFSEYAEGPKAPPPPPKTFDQLMNEGTDNALRNIARETIKPKRVIQSAPPPDGRRNGERLPEGNGRLLGPGTTEGGRSSDPKPGPNAKPVPVAEEPPSAEDFAEFERQLKRLAKVHGM